ncbi:MAG: hypothetical protein RTU30_03965 [Candidatus Thorarchaeota archaeon]
MMAETDKWRLVNGQVYKLGAVFKTAHDAVIHARKLKEEHLVHIHRISNELWAVYWRPRGDIVQCATKNIRIAGPLSISTPSNEKD